MNLIRFCWGIFKLKVKSKHRNGDISIRMSKDAFEGFMELLDETEDYNKDISLKILEDQIIDQENTE